MICLVVVVSWLIQSLSGRAQTLAVPTRTVTSYALTSSHEESFYDPSAWTLSGSLDGVKYAVLDVQTNQYFGARLQRKLYNITNEVAYNILRLQVYRSGAGASMENAADLSIQLAEVEYLGRLEGAASEDSLARVVSSSAPHPLMGPPENAFDGDLTSRWMDFGLAQSTNCWIECRYIHPTEMVVTKIEQLQLVQQLFASRELILRSGPRILANLTNPAAQMPKRLVGYAITSANDFPARDPKDWKLLGSNDRGSNWTTLDIRRNELFASRFQQRVFSLTNQVAYSTYRLSIEACGQTNGSIQIGELEPLFDENEKGDPGTMVVSAQSENPPVEGAEMAFDGDAKTKWFIFPQPGATEPPWIQWQFVPEEKDLPVVNQRRLQRFTDRSRKIQSDIAFQSSNVWRTITGYALTAANDYPERDPKDWKLLGSLDHGRSWKLLDVRTNEVFNSRFQRRVFALKQSATYPLYRLQIDSIRTPEASNGNSVQLAELEPLLEANDQKTRYSVVVAAHGDNPPRELADMLFDGRPQTKWLDFSRENSRRPSWIQWQYVTNQDDPVINLDRLHVPVAEVPWRMRLELDCMVASVISNIFTVVDPTGDQKLELGGVLPKVTPGDHVRLAGRLFLRAGLPMVMNADAVAVDTQPPTPPGNPGQANLVGSFTRGVIEGRAESVLTDSQQSTIRLTLTNGTDEVLVRLPSLRFLGSRSLKHCRVQAKGMVEFVFAPDGHLVPGKVWLSDISDLSLAPPAEGEWNAIPFHSLAVLLSTNAPEPGLIRVRGKVQGHDPTRGLILVDGTNRLRVSVADANHWSPGSLVEVAGFLHTERAGPELTMACAIAASDAVALNKLVSPPPEDAGTAPVPLEKVLQWARNYPNSTFFATLRGVITYVDMGLAYFYLQDGSQSIQVLGEMNAGIYPLLHQEGTYVELRARIKGDEVRPAAFIKTLGKARMPAAEAASWNELMTGRSDNRWVVVEGVVSAVEEPRLTLNIPGGQIVVWMNELDRNLSARLMSGLVRIRGVCAPVVNSRAQRLGSRLLVPSSQYLEILNPAPENLFAINLTPVGNILHSDSTHPGEVIQLIKTEGIVTFVGPRSFFLQDGGNGVRVFRREMLNAKPAMALRQGDRVMVAGLPEVDNFSTKIVQAQVRRVGMGQLPTAPPIDLAEINSGGEDIVQDGILGELVVSYIGHRYKEQFQILELRDPATDKSITAYLPASSEQVLPMVPGSLVRLKGVFKATSESAADIGRVLSSFEFYVNSINDITVVAHPSWWSVRHTLWILGGIGFVLIAALAWVGALRNQVRQRTLQLQTEIERRSRTGAKLEAEIVERKQIEVEMKKAHAELVTISRQAGMAEVATSVLHNVGNVLNSVNTSSSIIAERIRNSKVGNLTKAVALMGQHRQDLPRFFGEDPKGKQLPGYLGSLAERLEAERSEILGELTLLGQNIDHIKEIVAMQQSYSRVAGVLEPISADELMEDAMRLNSGSLERHGIVVVREFESTPPILVDKHKVLQILVNLLRNAKFALEDSKMLEKRLTLGIRSTGERVVISVADNGVGIPPENLTRIFQHGFTTRAGGHGFGLHSGALAASEMGGTLTVTSEGRGHGACFVLEFPCRPEAYKQARLVGSGVA